MDILLNFLSTETASGSFSNPLTTTKRLYNTPCLECAPIRIGLIDEGNKSMNECRVQLTNKITRYRVRGGGKDAISSCCSRLYNVLEQEKHDRRVVGREIGIKILFNRFWMKLGCT